MKVVLLSAVLSCACFAANGGGGAPVLLHTRRTTLALRLESGAWNVVHYGARVESAEDVGRLAWNAWSGRSSVGQRRPAAYAVYGGDKAGPYGFNKYGGLQVVHADGCVTTDLAGERAETLPDAPGAAHIALVQRDRAYPFTVVQHFRALEACDVIETWIELKNGEDGPVRLGRMDSFAMDFPLLSDEFRVQTATGNWGCEAQLRESAVERGQTVSFGARSGVRDSFENNASFMLSIGGRATETAGDVFGGVLCWTGTWGISVHRDQSDFLEIRAGADTAAGAYVLDAGKSIVLPKFAFTWSSAGKGQVSRNMHRWARDWQLPAGRKTRPVLLNSWEGNFFMYTEDSLVGMMAGVAEMGGEMFVLDDGWFGRGRHTRDIDGTEWGAVCKQGLGDWTVNPRKHPRGLGWLAGEAKKRGLAFGLWVEPEMANTNSYLYEEHPDWIIRERRRKVNAGRGGSQVVLDLSNPAVRDDVCRQLDAICAGTPGLVYLKWDANADFMNMGSAYLDGAHQANLPFDYTMGLYDILARLRAKWPGIDIQACSSGGGHVDYGFLRYADEFWGSDVSDARERVFIQWGECQFYPACCIAAHVTGVPNHCTKRTTPLKYRFDVAMSARLGFELRPENLSPDEVAFARACVANYKRIRRTVQQGDLYRLVSPYGHGHAALMYVNDDASHAVVFIWGLERWSGKDFLPPLRLQGLRPGGIYRVAEINRTKGAAPHVRVDGATLSGASLAAMGLPARLSGDYDSAVIELTDENKDTKTKGDSR